MSTSDAPPETAVDLFRGLQRLVAEHAVALRYDYKRLQHIDCPAASEADGNIWAYTALAAALAAFWAAGWRWGLGVAAAGVVAYMTLAKAYIRYRIRKRIDERALASLDAWQRLWRFGGIALLADGKACQAPQESWMELVRRCRSESRSGEDAPIVGKA